MVLQQAPLNVIILGQPMPNNKQGITLTKKVFEWLAVITTMAIGKLFKLTKDNINRNNNKQSSEN
jgi:hypothetical protein